MKNSALILILVFNTFGAFCQLNLAIEKHYDLKNFKDIMERYSLERM